MPFASPATTRSTTMSTSAVSACVALVKDIEHLVATLPTICAADGGAAADKLNSRAWQLKAEPKLGRAEWKRLLDDKKARHRTNSHTRCFLACSTLITECRQ